MHLLNSHAGAVWYGTPLLAAVSPSGSLYMPSQHAGWARFAVVSDVWALALECICDTWQHGLTLTKSQVAARHQIEATLIFALQPVQAATYHDGSPRVLWGVLRDSLHFALLCDGGGIAV